MQDAKEQLCHQWKKQNPLGGIYNELKIQTLKDLQSLEPICVIKGEIFHCKCYLLVPALEKGNIVINPRSNNDFHFQVSFHV